jgi:hypothetical protein
VASRHRGGPGRAKARALRPRAFADGGSRTAATGPRARANRRYFRVCSFAALLSAVFEIATGTTASIAAL